MKWIPLVTFVTFVTSATSVVAQDTVTTLNPMTITATRSAEPVVTIASSVTVLDGAELRRAGVATVVEALRGVPSVVMAQAGGRGAQTSLFLRGGESDYVRVLVDGVAINQAGGAVDLANMTTENVERIEVVRGPSSVLYGSDAMTGVIQIITRHGAGPAHLAAEARGGSRDAMLGSLEARAGNQRVAFSAGIQREGVDGVDDLNNRYEHTSASGRLSLGLGSRGDLQLAARHRDGVFHFPTDGSGAATDSNQFQYSRLTAVSADAGRRLSRGLELRALLSLAFGRDSSDNRPDSPGDTTGFFASESRRDNLRRTAELRANIGAGRLVLTPGIAIESERVTNRGSFQADFGSGTTPEATLSRTNRAGYLQAVANNGPVSVQAGLRLDDNQRFGSFTTWRAGASWRVSSATRLRVNAGTAFKEPTFDENYSTAFSNGNPGLEPEQTTSIEAGIERWLGTRARLSVTGFTQRFRDLIQYTFMTAQPADPNYYNVAAARASGAETQLDVMPGTAITITAQYTYTKTTVADSGFDGTVFAEGNRLLRRPAHTATLGLELRPARRFTIGARAVYVGDRDDLDFSVVPTARVQLGAYARADAWLSAVVLGGDAARGALALTARVENLTGTAYQEIYGFRTPGRRLMLGARVDAGMANR